MFCVSSVETGPGLGQKHVTESLPACAVKDQHGQGPPMEVRHLGHFWQGNADYVNRRGRRPWGVQMNASATKPVHLACGTKAARPACLLQQVGQMLVVASPDDWDIEEV